MTEQILKSAASRDAPWPWPLHNFTQLIHKCNSGEITAEPASGAIARLVATYGSVLGGAAAAFIERNGANGGVGLRPIGFEARKHKACV